MKDPVNPNNGDMTNIEKKNYMIVTPAYNESRYIEQTIKSLLVQTLLPKVWVIVDDGSTDDTAGIIKRYAEKYSWIRYVNREKHSKQSYYASNVYAIEKGLEAVRQTDFDYLAILDADISLPMEYYEILLARMETDQKLGIASGVYVDHVNGKLRKILNDRRSTPKALMVFRKKCYSDVGGLRPMKYGGEDTCACFTARMKGWKTWSFPNLVAVHNKPVGTGHAGNICRIRFRQGLNEYGLATHPLFMLFKSLRRCVKEPPYLLGGLARMTGFLYGCCRREKRQISDEVVRFIRREQLGRLFNCNRVPDNHKVADSNV